MFALILNTVHNCKQSVDLFFFSNFEVLLDLFILHFVFLGGKNNQDN